MLGLIPTPIVPGRQRQPLWPLGVVGSITHCTGYCAAAVAHRTRFVTIGIDAEIHDKLPEGTLDLVALSRECEWLQSSPNDGIHWDRVLFSVKESIYKAWFPIAGKWLGFKDVLVSFDPSSRRFRARLLVSGPVVKGRTLTHFSGRYVIVAGRVLTAVSLQD